MDTTDSYPLSNSPHFLGAAFALGCLASWASGEADSFAWVVVLGGIFAIFALIPLSIAVESFFLEREKQVRSIGWLLYVAGVALYVVAFNNGKPYTDPYNWYEESILWSSTALVIGYFVIGQLLLSFLKLFGAAHRQVDGS